MDACGETRGEAEGRVKGEVKMAVQIAGLRRAAVFVDYDNLKLRGSWFLSPGEVLEAIHRDLEGKAVVQFGNVYMGMGRPDDPTLIDRGKIYQAYSRGMTPVTTPSFRGSGAEAVKDLTDSSALVDITESIFVHPEIDAYVVCTGDKDLNKAVRKLREHGKAVRVYYRRECASILAAEIEWLKGDGFSSVIDLEDMLQRLPGMESA